MENKFNLSFLFFIIIIIASHLYYPKWQKSGTEATISWDVSGYYFYLPSIFIYKDIKQVKFRKEILKKYQPTYNFQQGFKHEKSGNIVMKYSIGQAVTFLPFFTIAHIWASSSDQYSADGFSFPYQLMISIGSLLFTFLGIFFLMKILRIYFSFHTTFFTVFFIIIGTNYLNYSAIDGAMTHNSLFTLYAILLYTSHHFHKIPTLKTSSLIGLIVGLLTLIRPTEVISLLIPTLFGVNIFNFQQLKARFIFFARKWKILFTSIIIAFFIASIQAIYWHYVTGDWIVYSYQEQGFSWLKPHIKDGFISYRSGWLTYSPLMIFSLIGFYFLVKKSKRLFAPLLLFTIIFIYIAFAWDIWWYGGSLGQRAMVQAYPILAFPFAAFINWLFKQNKIVKSFLLLILAIFSYFSLWFTHQAHLGGKLIAGQMTKAYFWKTLGTFKKDLNDLKLLDTDEYFNGERKVEKVKLIHNSISNIDKTKFCFKDNKLCLNKQFQNTPEIKIPHKKNGWVRVSANFEIKEKEWNFWEMTQFIVRFYDDRKIIKEKMIRVQRLMQANQQKIIFLDTKTPSSNCTDISISFWNANGQKEIIIDQIQLEYFN